MKASLLLRCWCALCLLGLVGPGWAAPTLVRVGAYSFPPYLEGTQGATPRFLALLNSHQDRWRFVLVRTSARRRYIELDAGVFDMMAFENPQWSWNAAKIRTGRPLLRDAERTIARSAPGRDQSFFASAHTRVAVFGFHYGFSGQRALTGGGPELYFVAKPALVLEQVLSGKSAQGIITESYLERLLAADPELAPRLLVREKKDCEYTLGPLFSPRSPISPDEFDQLLTHLSGPWKNFVAAEGLRPAD